MPTFPVSSAGGGVACSLEGSSLFLFPLEMLPFFQTINRKSIFFYLTVIHFVCVFGIATLFLSPRLKTTILSTEKSPRSRETLFESLVVKPIRNLVILCCVFSVVIFVVPPSWGIRFNGTWLSRELTNGREGNRHTIVLQYLLRHWPCNPVSSPSQFLGKVLVVSRSFNSFLVRAVDVGW
jgi:hypothetical protein